MERPFHYGWEQNWNVEHTHNEITMLWASSTSPEHVMFPLLKTGKVDGIELEGMKWVSPQISKFDSFLLPVIDQDIPNHELLLIKNLVWTGSTVKGFAIGSPGSRVCEFEFDPMSPVDYMIDSEEKWSVQQKGELGSTSSIQIHRRNFDRERRIEIPFSFTFTKKSDLNMTLICHHAILDHSPSFKQLLASQPVWMSRQLKRKSFKTYGDLTLRKQFQFSGA
jgi:hypothetical protein